MKLLEKLIEHLISHELANILFEQSSEEQNDGPLYHVTYYNRLEGISEAGLRPGMGRSIGAPAYDAHARKGIFLTEDDGVRFWYSKAEEFANHQSDNPLEDGLVPIVLRIDPAGFTEEELSDDALGTRDAMSGAYIHPIGIDPEYINVWDGSGWISVDDWQDIDIEQAFDREEIEDEDGGPEEYYLFKYHNPLKPL